MMKASAGALGQNTNNGMPSTSPPPLNNRKIGIFPRRRRPAKPNVRGTIPIETPIAQEPTIGKKRKLAKDNNVDASDQTFKKQYKVPVTLEACYCCKRHGHPCFLQSNPSEHEFKQQPSTETSYIQEGFSDSLSRVIVTGNYCATCRKAGHIFEACPKQDIMCFHCEQYGHYVRQCPIKKLTPSDLGLWLFKRQVEDEVLSQAMSKCSLKESSPNVEQQNPQTWTLPHSEDVNLSKQLHQESTLAQVTPKHTICRKCAKAKDQPTIHIARNAPPMTEAQQRKVVRLICIRCGKEGRFAS